MKTQHTRLWVISSLVLIVTACTTVKPDEEYRPQYPITDEGFYLVREGDTLSYIATHFGRSMATLKCWNKIPREVSVV